VPFDALVRRCHSSARIFYEEIVGYGKKIVGLFITVASGIEERDAIRRVLGCIGAAAAYAVAGFLSFKMRDISRYAVRRLQGRMAQLRSLPNFFDHALVMLVRDTLFDVWRESRYVWLPVDPIRIDGDEPPQRVWGTVIMNTPAPPCGYGETRLIRKAARLVVQKYATRRISLSEAFDEVWRMCGLSSPAVRWYVTYCVANSCWLSNLDDFVAYLRDYPMFSAIPTAFLRLIIDEKLRQELGRIENTRYIAEI